MNPRHLSIAAFIAFTGLAPAQQSGLTYERWNNLPGTSLETLRRNGINARVADHTGTVTLAQSPSNTGDNHGTRLRGRLTAPATGDYTFFIAGDDNAELWLAHESSSDTTAPWNRRLIAWHRNFTSTNQWDKYPTQRSQVIRLEAGQSYHLEALAKEAGGEDHLSVGWHRVESGTPAATTWSAHTASFTPQAGGTTHFTIVSADIWGTKDNGAFHHQPWTGNGVFTIEIGGLNNPHAWAKSGLMIRETLDENSRHAFLVRRTGSNGIVFQRRPATGGTSSQAAATAENWSHLRLERAGDIITARVSPDGQAWTLLGTTTLTDLAPTIHIGFAANSNTTASAPLTGWHGPLDARETTAADPIPAPPATSGAHHWQPVTATWTPRPDGTLDFQVTSGDIWAGTDRATFHARTWSGDGEFITWLGDFDATHPSAKAGIMLRAHAGDRAPHASLFQTSARGISFQRRATEAGTTTATTVATGPVSTHPWLRLVRSATTITASSSLDGRVWETLGSVTIANLPHSILIGHAVSSITTTSTASGHFGPITARPPTATEIIPGIHLTPHAPHPDDPHDTGLPQSWRLQHNLHTSDRFGPNGPHGDPDNDGLDNLTEYQLASDPNSSSPAPAALTREIWSPIPGQTINNLITHSRFHQLPNEISLVPGVDSVGLHWNLPYGARYRGTITPAATGTYRFWIAGDNHAELWLADGSITPRGESTPRTDRFGKRRIAWIRDERFGKDFSAHADFDHHPSQRSAAIHLHAGQPYHIEVLHKASGAENRGHVSLAWQPPGQPRHIIPAEFFQSILPSSQDLDDNGLPDPWQNNNNLTDPALSLFQRGQYGDPDGDGLINLLEYQHGTKPRNPDTDNDGLTDYNEIFLYGTDPLVPNILPNTPIANQPAPHQYTQATGGWTANPDGTLSAWDRRGEITYTFTTQAAGIHEVVLTGSAIGDIRPVERLPITLILNTATIANGQLVSQNGNPGTLRAITPVLSPGTHTLTILHDNYRTARRLKIHSIEIIHLGGEDFGGIPGIPDWAEHDAHAANTLTRIPTTSRTSPLSIEGVTQNLATTTLTHTPPGTHSPIPLTLTPSINTSFFAELPLSENGETSIAASFLQGAIPPQTHTISWIPTNLFEFGGTGTIAPATKTHGVNLSLSDGSGFSRPGHTFAGWNTAADGSGTDYPAAAPYTANANVTLYAKWTEAPSGATESTETFDTAATTAANGWTASGNTTNGHNFGWSATGIGSGGAAGGIFARSTSFSHFADTQIVALNRTNTLRLAGSFRLANNNFDGNFRLGYFTPGAGASNFVGLTFVEPAGAAGDPFRGFAGVTGPGGAGTGVIALPQNTTLTFDLTWTGNPDGSGTLTGTLAGQSVNVTAGPGTGTFTAFGLLCGGAGSNATTRRTAACHFDNLTYHKDGSTAATYTLSYHTNGGTGNIAPANKTHGVDLTLSDGSGFSRPGQTFAGWNTAADGSGTDYPAAAPYTANANVTLYAKWTEAPSGATEVTETFDTAATAAANGWTASGNTTNGQNFGWSAAGIGAGGAAGGFFARSTSFSHFADTMTGPLDRTNTLRLAGSFRLANDNFDGNFRLGYFTPGAGASNFVGLTFVEPAGAAGDPFRGFAGVTGPGGAGTGVIALPQNTTLTFDLTWTGNPDGSGTLTGTLAGQSVNVTAGPGTGTFTAFGLLCGGAGSTLVDRKTAGTYFDNLTYHKDAAAAATYTVSYDANDRSELHIRQNDALLLTAHPVAAATGSFTLNGGAGTPATSTEPQPSDIPVAITFDTPGTHTLTATWSPPEGPDQVVSVTLHVHAADFGPAHSVRAYSPRPWTPTLLGPTHLVEADDRLTLAETTADPETGPRTFLAAVHHAGNRHTIARLPNHIEGAPSAILARGTVHGFYLAYLDETTDPEIIHRYADGTWLMRGTMVAVNLPPDILIRLTSIFQGTVFHNGSNTLWLDQSHFNANGIANIHYEWAGSGSPRLCNRLHLFLKPD